jgi:hypothetical protein
MGLTEIGESMCSLCFSPIAGGIGGRGSDNMTILIVAILNGRTKEEWYIWMHNRVANNYGYPTPSQTPQMYHPDEIEAAREEAIKRREEEHHFHGTGSTINDDGSDFMLLLQAFNAILDTGEGKTFATTGKRKKDGSLDLLICCSD